MRCLSTILLLKGVLLVHPLMAEEDGAGDEQPEAGSEVFLESMPAIPPGTNILWDAGFDTGYGNGCWTALANNGGPSFREMWSSEGTITLKTGMGSRLYLLENGTYTLSAWVKRIGGSPQDAKKPPGITLELNNLNYVRDKQKNVYAKGFPVPEGDGWQKVGWTFEVKESVRPCFHVEVKGSEGVLLDEVSLVKGPATEGRPPRMSMIEAGFDIPEETRIYVDGEERVADLIVANHGAAEAKPKVKWAVYDEYEDLVKEGFVEEAVSAGKTIRKRIRLAELPYGGYRLAADIEGYPMMGDALLAILPKIDAKAYPFMGADANVREGSAKYMTRFMTRLGMNTVNALSCANVLARWSSVNPEPGKYVWQDESMQVCKDAGMEVVLYMQGFANPPGWAKKAFENVDSKANRKGVVIPDEKGFTEAYCKYVEEVVKHYGDKIGAIVFDDECNFIFQNKEAMEQLGRIYAAVCASVRKASTEKGIKFPYGTHGGPPDWLKRFLDVVPVSPENYEFCCLNSNSRPYWAAQCLEVAHKKELYPTMYRTAGVGQGSRMRKTSLIQDRPRGGSPMSVFVASSLLHAWVSRPYGTEDPKDGALVNYGYYDMRTLQRTAYAPVSGKTGVEFDNSPALGMQAMAMMKYQFQGMRPARPTTMSVLDSAHPDTVRGYPTANPGVMAYPFRNDKDAVVALLAEDDNNNNHDWTFSGVDFKALKPEGIFARPIKVAEDGSITARELPVYLHVPAVGLPALLEGLKNLKADVSAKEGVKHFEAGPYALDVDLERAGYFTLWRNKDGRKTVLLDKFSIKALPGKPHLGVIELRNGVSVRIGFDPKHVFAITISLAPDGCRLLFESTSTRGKIYTNGVSVRIGTEAADKFMTIQQGKQIQAGKLRTDFGVFFPAEAGKVPSPANISEFASRVTVDGFATFDMSPSNGKGYSPATGFLWKTLDGEGLFDADFTLPAYTGGGSKGRQSVSMTITVK